MKNRLKGLLVFLVGAGATAFNWRLLLNDGYYYTKLTLLGPLFAVGGLTMIFYPGAGARFRSATRTQKVVIVALIVAGTALGVMNAYLMYNYRP